MYFVVNDYDDSPKGEEHDVQSHTFSQYKGNHKRGGAAECRATSFVVAPKGRHHCISALNKVNIVAATLILVLHVGNGRSEHV